MKNKQLKLSYSSLVKNADCHAVDGNVGECKDLLFYQEKGHIAYFVVETGSWLSKRPVLISPAALDLEATQGNFLNDLKDIQFKLSRDAIEHSPPYEENILVSVQYEKALASHYKWPFYAGNSGSLFAGNAGLWGPQVASGQIRPVRNEEVATSGEEEISQGSDRSIRSANEILGYTLSTSNDENTAKLEDLVLNFDNWSIPYLNFKEATLLNARRILLPYASVENISASIKAIKTALPIETVLHAPPAPENPVAPDSDLERRIEEYFSKADD